MSWIHIFYILKYFGWETNNLWFQLMLKMIIKIIIMCINSTCSYQWLGNEYIIIEWNEKGYYLRFEKNINVWIFIVPKSWQNFRVKRNRLISKSPINYSGHMCFYSISHIFSCSMPHHFHWKYCGERKLA